MKREKSAEGETVSLLLLLIVICHSDLQLKAATGNDRIWINEKKEKELIKRVTITLSSSKEFRRCFLTQLCTCLTGELQLSSSAFVLFLKQCLSISGALGTVTIVAHSVFLLLPGDTFIFAATSMAAAAVASLDNHTTFEPIDYIFSLWANKQVN